MICDSRYSALYCQDIACFNVFLTCPIEIRAQRGVDLGKYEDRSLQQVIAKLQKREQDEVERGKQLFEGRDYRDSKYYHLILNTGLLTID